MLTLAGSGKARRCAYLLLKKKGSPEQAAFLFATDLAALLGGNLKIGEPARIGLVEGGLH